MWILFDAACVAFFLSLVLTPLVRDTALRIGLVDHADSDRKIHTGVIPRLGGIAVFAAYLLALIFILFAPYRHLSIDRTLALNGAVSLLPAVLLIFAIGILDDIVGLKPWQKLLGQVGASMWAFFGGFGIHVLRGHPMEMWASLAITVAWLVICTNAVNLIDGMDGLAAGVGLFAAGTTLLAASVHHSVELALVTAPLVGSLLGFLRYNFNPASIFLGDCGSLLIGFLLGCYGAIWSHKTETILGMTAPLMALAIPLLDVCVSILRRFITRKPIFTADRNHIHHRLLNQGLTPRRAALILYGVCGLAAVFSLLEDMSYNKLGGLIILLFCGIAWLGIQHLGYTEFRIAGNVIFRSFLRRTIDVHIRLHQFKQALEAAPDCESRWILIARGAEEFGFMGVQMKIEGEFFSTLLPSDNVNELWQLRIPLSNTQYIKFYRDINGAMHPAVLNEFSGIVHQVLVHCASSFTEETAKEIGRAVSAGVN